MDNLREWNHTQMNWKARDV